MSGHLNASMFAACRERNAANASMFADASSGKTTLFLYRRKAFLANFSPSAINFGAWRRGSSTPSSELRSELDANEIYEDLATGRPLPFLRVGQVDAFADASVSFTDIQLRLDAHKHWLRW